MSTAPARLALVLCLLAAGGPALAQDAPYDPLLDLVLDPAWKTQLGGVAPARVELPGAEKFGYAEWTGGGGLLYLQTAAGDVDLGGSYRLLALTDQADVGLPDTLGRASLDLAWTVRPEQAPALRFEAHPGVYSDLEDLSAEDVRVPFGVSAIQRFSDQFSGVLGLMVYPGFQTPFDPRLGLRYVPFDTLVIDLMYPESRITFSPEPGWFLLGGLRVDRTSDFQLEDGDPRGSFALRETRMYGGLQVPAGDVLQLLFEAGVIQHREIEFEHVQGQADVADAYYFSVGLSGRL